MPQSLHYHFVHVSKYICNSRGECEKCSQSPPVIQLLVKLMWTLTQGPLSSPVVLVSCVMPVIVKRWNICFATGDPPCTDPAYSPPPQSRPATGIIVTPTPSPWRRGVLIAPGGRPVRSSRWPEVITAPLLLLHLSPLEKRPCHFVNWRKVVRLREALPASPSHPHRSSFDLYQIPNWSTPPDPLSSVN